ncbi:MAG: argininosuccinate lyase [Candidatus Omnitrophota bacterium]|nr:MAG: argininosuccinate lyase [Candidatus Omnitrophota bacterium]
MKKLWGGRFKKKTNPLVEEFTKSIHYDYKLAKYDLAGSITHVKILEKCGYLTSDETSELETALESIGKEIGKKDFTQNEKCEDIHTYIQNELQKKVGNLALKLQTARSRNDQVVFATKLYCKEEAIPDLQSAIKHLVKAIDKLVDENKNIILPGFTHMQHAQPVYLKDYLGAYCDMLKRDSNRLKYISQNMKVTLGAGALAGTPIKADIYEAADVEAVINSIDSVSDRDFVIEIISALSIVAMHLSRLAEDLIIYSSKEFDFIEIDEAFCTGSSLMPQKKNPDVLELVRGYSGRLYGNLVSMLTMMKGLPLSYNRDMQLDKESLFSSFEIVSQELEVLTGLIKTLKFNKAKIKEHLEDESLYATDLVYYLVDKEVPFAQAHEIAGELYRYSLDNKLGIKGLPQKKLKKFSDKIVKKEIVRLFNPAFSVRSKKSIKRAKA